jgi:hypothetical protein
MGLVSVLAMRQDVGFYPSCIRLEAQIILDREVQQFPQSPQADSRLVTLAWQLPLRIHNFSKLLMRTSFNAIQAQYSEPHFAEALSLASEIAPLRISTDNRTTEALRQSKQQTKNQAAS